MCLKHRNWLKFVDKEGKTSPAGSQSACPSPCTGWRRQKASFRRTGCTPAESNNWNVFYIFHWNQNLFDVAEPRDELLAGDGLAILVLVPLTYQPATIWWNLIPSTWNENTCKKNMLKPEFIGEKVCIAGDSSYTAHLDRMHDFNEQCGCSKKQHRHQKICLWSITRQLQ